MADMTITYDGYTFPYSRLSVEDRPVYASDGRTLIGTETNLTVDGTIVASSAENFLTEINKLRAAASRARKTLTVGIGAALYFSVTADTDDNWGPKPQPLQLNQFTGGLAASYTWRVQTFTKYCFGAIGSPARARAALGLTIMSLTRTYNHVIDPNGLCTRIVSGTLIVRKKNSPSDALRALVTPPIPKYFKRIGQRFQQSEDGRTLTFSFTDQEQHHTLPKPITTGEATFSIRVDEKGAIARFTLSGHFEAPPSVSTRVLTQAVVNLVESRFDVNDDSIIFDTQEIREAVYGNRIDFSFSAMTGGDFLVRRGKIMQTTFLGKKPPGSDGNAQSIGPYGSSGVRGGDFPIFEACDGDAAISEGIPASGLFVAPSGAGAPTPAQSTQPQASFPNISKDHKIAPYLAYHERISYEWDNAIRVFPVKSTKSNVNPVVQQAHHPTLRVIQAGFATRAAPTIKPNLGPKVPKPIVSKGDGVILHISIQPSVPELIGNGKHSMFTIHWRYVMEMTRTVKMDLLEQVFWPGDPRKAVSGPLSFRENLPGELTKNALVL